MLLIYTIHALRRLNLSDSQMRKQRALNLTIIAITLLFILLTGTGAVVNFFIAELEQTYTGNVIMALGDVVCFTFHALNIVSLLITNRRFRQEFYSLSNIKQMGELESVTKPSVLNTASKY